MVKIILILLSGILIGFLLRKKNLSAIHRCITLLIWGLLFFLGVSLGRNEALLNNLSTLGMDALIITTGGVAGSIFMAWIIFKHYFSEHSDKNNP
ncbi:MAG: LysO family transporter [Bacteroidales bacterium]